MKNAPFVLVVEDDEACAELMALAVSECGFESEIAVSGSAACEKTRRIGLVAVILDLDLPDINGIHVLETIRSFSDVPIMVVTARTAVSTGKSTPSCLKNPILLWGRISIHKATAGLSWTSTYI